MTENFNTEKLKAYDIPLTKWFFRQRDTKAIEMSSKGISIDIGCGRGHLTAKRKETVGVDLSPNLVDIKKKHRNRDFVRCNAEYLPFRGESFENVFLLDALEHVQDCEKATKEAKRILKKDGSLILSLPNENYFYKVFSKLFRTFYGGPYPPDLHSYDYVKDVVSKRFDKIDTQYIPKIPSFFKLWEISKYKSRKK